MFAILAATVALGGAAPVNPAKAFGEDCVGTETVRIGDQPATTAPYRLTFSVDLAARTYCYDRCGADQTYVIGDVRADRITLADIARGGQVREMILDRRTGALSDHQSYDGGLGLVVRDATAACRRVAVKSPPAPQG